MSSIQTKVYHTLWKIRLKIFVDVTVDVVYVMSWLVFPTRMISRSNLAIGYSIWRGLVSTSISDARVA